MFLKRISKAKILLPLMALALVLIFTTVAQADKVTIVKVQGSVNVQSAPDTAWESANSGQKLSAGTIVRTGASSSCILRWPQGHSLRLQPLTTLSVTRDAPGETVTRVKSGKVTAHVEKLSAGQRFEVETPTAIAGVRGTDYFVHITPDGAAIFGVTAGEIFVAIGAEIFSVEQDFMISVDASGAPGDPVPIPEEIRQEIRNHLKDMAQAATPDEPGTATGDNTDLQETEEAVDQAVESVDVVLDEQDSTLSTSQIEFGSGSVHFDIYISQ